MHFTVARGKVKVHLDASDHGTIAEGGRRRQFAKDARGIQDGRHHYDDGDQPHILGLAGEYAAARYLGVEPDWEVGPTGNKGVAFWIAEKAIAVEANTRYDGDLRFDLRKDGKPKIPNADFFVLVQGTLERGLYLAGFARREEVVTGGFRFMLSGKGERWLYRHTRLHPMEQLKVELGMVEAKPVVEVVPQQQPLFVMEVAT